MIVRKLDTLLLILVLLVSIYNLWINDYKESLAVKRGINESTLIDIRQEQIMLNQQMHTYLLLSLGAELSEEQLERLRSLGGVDYLGNRPLQESE